ncbi:MAG: cytochrome b/b6 domain-containing protein [Syntrophorhabdaceae bacterium]|nr:cytochrome b/b6 domain-containing protein [Syntrophorhabdaceae bacterium]
MKKNETDLHPFLIRIWHWANALIVFVLIVTGADLRFTDVDIFSDYGFTVALHKYAGYLLAISFLFWIAAYQILGGFTRHYVLSLKDMRSIPAQTTYYIHGHFRGGVNPFKASPSSRFNALQKLAYSFIMFIAMPLIIATGIVFGNIMDFYALISATGGIRVLDIIHVVVGYIFVIYLIIHLYMATLGKHVFSHTKAMITGREE